jgi:hypothetical protein
MPVEEAAEEIPDLLMVIDNEDMGRGFHDREITFGAVLWRVPFTFQRMTVLYEVLQVTWLRKRRGDGRCLGGINHTRPPVMDMQQCIQNCLDCHRTCLETSIHCLGMGGDHAAVDHQRLLADCAQICVTSADFMIRGSTFHQRTCGVCAEVCEACAQECEGMGGGDQHMAQCADMCRKCAESCRQMAA